MSASMSFIIQHFKKLQNGNYVILIRPFYDCSESREIVYSCPHTSFLIESQMMFNSVLPIHFLIANNLHLHFSH